MHSAVGTLATGSETGHAASRCYDAQWLHAVPAVAWHCGAEADGGDPSDLGSGVRTYRGEALWPRFSRRASWWAKYSALHGRVGSPSASATNSSSRWPMCRCLGSSAAVHVQIVSRSSCGRILTEPPQTSSESHRSPPALSSVHCSPRSASATPSQSVSMAGPPRVCCPCGTVSCQRPPAGQASQLGLSPSRKRK
jgi:hypothetical protein